MNNIKDSKNLITRVSLLLLVILLSALVFSGCRPGGTMVVPKGWSGAVTDNNTLFVGSMEGNIAAASIEDGRLIWATPLETGQVSGGWFGCSQATTTIAIYGSPSINGDLVYVAGYNGRIYAFNNETGATRWVYPRDGYLDNIVGGPLIESGNLYFASSDGKVYALNAETGDDRIWKEPFNIGNKIWSTPAIEGNTLYIGSFDNKLYAINTTTGKEKWEEPFETGGAIVSTPVIHNNTVFIGSFDRHIYAVNAATGKEIWRYPDNGEEKDKPGNWFWAKPVIYGNTIYAGCLDGKVYAINAGNGKLVAKIDLGSPISSSPVIVGDLLVVAATQERPKKTTIYTIDTDNEEMLILSLDEEVHAPLATTGGKVYVHTADNFLYEVDPGSGAKRNIVIKLEKSD